MKASYKQPILKRVISEAHKLAISKKLKGIPRSPAVREKIRLGNLGKIAPQEQRDKQSATNKGRLLTPEWKAKISESMKGYVRSKESVQKMADANRGQKRTKKQRKNISIGAKKREQRKRVLLNKNKKNSSLVIKSNKEDMSNYSIDELRNIHYHSPVSRRTGKPVEARAHILLHRHRAAGAAARNDFDLNKKLLAQLGLGSAKIIKLMVANFPDKCLQVVLNPKGIQGITKEVNIKKGGNLTFGMGGLIEEFVQQNGMDYTDKDNYFFCELDYKVTYQDGKMIALEFSIKEETLILEHRD